MESKTSNHAKAPLSASFVAQMRQEFGDVTVLYVNEGGVVLGEPQSEGAPCIHGASGELLSAIHGEKKGKKAA